MKFEALNPEEKITRVLQQYGEHDAYILLDGARFEDIYPFLYKNYDHPAYIALYKGTYFESTMEGGPFLVQLQGQDDKLLSWYTENGDDAKKGLLLVSQLNLQDLADHFHEFLKARRPNNEIVLFRFYDPDILHALAPLHDKIANLLKPLLHVFWKKDAPLCQLP